MVVLIGYSYSFKVSLIHVDLVFVFLFFESLLWDLMVKRVCVQLVYSHDPQNQVTFVVARVFSTGSMLTFRVS